MNDTEPKLQAQFTLHELRRFIDGLEELKGLPPDALVYAEGVGRINGYRLSYEDKPALVLVTCNTK